MKTEEGKEMRTARGLIEATFSIRGTNWTQQRFYNEADFTASVDVDQQVREKLAQEFKVAIYETGLLAVRKIR